MVDTESNHPPPRRQRDRTNAQPRDLADKLVALQRKAAGPPRRTERTTTATTVAAPQPAQSTSQLPPPQHLPLPPSTPPSPPHRRPNQMRDPSPDEFDRRNPNVPRPQGRLYNPHSDTIPRRQIHREPDVDSDTSSAVGQRSNRRRIPQLPPTHAPPSQPISQPHRLLFDPRRDDPVRFSVLNRTVPKPPTGPPSGGYISASSTSVSDAQSLGSNYTLTSGTTSSSASNPYSPAHSRELGGNRLWLEQMKRMYREIATLEARILSEGDVVDEDIDSRESAAPAQPSKSSEEKWARLVQEHKQLTELDHGFLSFALKPQVPASLQSLPAKYNIPARLWNHGFQRLLAALRRASISSPSAFEQLQSFIIYAYGFYTSLLEEENLAQFRVLWLEALGDLSRYQMAVVAHIAHGAPRANLGHLNLPIGLALPTNSNSPGVSRMEDSPLPSVGAHAAAELELEDERELWRRNAREWYTRGIKDTPGQGRLHHHLGLVSADADGEELRAVYHFVKSLMANHPCDIARESILPLFSVQKQSARYQPSSNASSIFLLMHGMLFTRIQLDDFPSNVARFMERIQLNPTEVGENEWIMMAMLNIGAILEYGRPEGVLRKVCGWGATLNSTGHAAARPASSRTPRSDPRRSGSQGEQMQVDTVVVDADPEDMQDDRMVDVAEVLSGPMEALSTSAGAPGLEELPYTMQLALQLTFEMLRYAMRTPWITPASAFRQPVLNPYLTTIFTFLATIFKHEQAILLLERYVPWTDLTLFLTDAFRRTSSSRSNDEEKSMSRWFGSNPLPEDWCLRGSEWVRRVYERGFWRSSGKGDSGISSEMDVLIPPPTPWDDAADGIVMDMEGDANRALEDWTSGRNKRLRWSAEQIIRCVHGLEWLSEGQAKMAVMSNPLQMKVELWEAEKRREEEAERKRHERVAWKETEDMELDGLVNNPTELGAAATAALNYLVQAVQTLSTSLKVQTSKGNYLRSLSIRSEETVLGMAERNMDDLILRTAMWHVEHFVDRSNLLRNNEPRRSETTSKVVLLTFDRNLRLKARSRKLDAADEKDMATILNSAAS
ncbi:hypothetical protein FRB99_007736 [Tulasnella sp. 403]|nr:hypothetical protein FRB99_007736 [Tulasnella sp. 403]